MTVYGRRTDTGEDVFCPFGGGEQADQCGSWCPMFREIVSVQKNGQRRHIGYECAMAVRQKGSVIMEGVGSDES